MTVENNAEEKPVSGADFPELSGVRIARVSTVPFFILTQLRQQIQTLRNCGAQIWIATSSGMELEPLRALTGAACEAIEIPRAVSPWRDLLALLQLIRFFRRNRIMIAHSTTPKAGLLTAIAALLAGVPIRIHTFTGQPWVGMKGLMRHLARRSDWLIGKLNTRCYADSDSQKRFLIEQGIIPPHKLFVIGAGSLAGVDMERFNPERISSQERDELNSKLGIPHDAPVILFVGRIAPDKGVRELFAAFDELKAAGSAAHLVLVGPFDSERGGGEDHSLRGIDRVPDTHFAGYTERPEAYMAIADILCLPSYREGFGTVVIEAAAMGVPTVGTDIYGLSDAVVNGETGILVPPRDSSALAAALAILLKQEARRTEMGLAAKERAKKNFEAGRVNRMVVEEYLRLLDGRQLR
ncbi:MAG: glycosyltransferase [Nitrosomonadales bacterium]|nr:glycosyltransferase [Nitrosomonadales bacterium]